MIKWTNIPVDHKVDYILNLDYKLENGFELYDYQKNIYSYMVQAMTKNYLNVDSDLFSIKSNDQLNVSFLSKFGILGTPVGSGKTWLSLFLIKNFVYTDLLNNPTNILSLSFSNNLFSIKYKSQFYNSSLIVVSNNQMLNQWVHEAKVFFNLDLKIFKGEFIDNNNYIITFNHLKNLKFNSFFIKFLIIDELNFSFINIINAKFTWILSADAPSLFSSSMLDKKHFNSNLGQLKKYLDYLKTLNISTALPFLLTCNNNYKYYVDMNFKININYLDINTFDKRNYVGKKMIVLNDYFFTRLDMPFLNFKNKIINYFLLNYNSFKFVDKDLINVNFNSHDLYIVKQSLINNGLNFQNISHVFFFPFLSINFEIVINQLLHRFIRIRREKELFIWQLIDNDIFSKHLLIEFSNY
jgi:hypothetical protein